MRCWFIRFSIEFRFVVGDDGLYDEWLMIVVGCGWCDFYVVVN